MSEQVFSEFLAAFYGRCFAHLKVGGPIYVAHADGEPSFTFRQEFRQAGFKYATCLIWRKNQATLGRSDYQYQHEPILYGWKPGGGHCWYGGRKKKSIAGFGDPPLFSRQEDGSWHIRYGEELLVISGTDVKVASLVPSIISIEKPLRSALHPTMKPVALIEHYLLNSSRPGDIVLDPFGGSGSTLIACERRGRCCRTIELDPRFADVIVRRWQEFTGRQAALEDGRTLADLEAQRGVHAG
jgi:DNA modification methylase